MNTTRAWCVIILSAALSACSAPKENVATPSTYGLGHEPSAAQLAALDIDVDASGHGLPPGRGTAAEGALVYAQQCAVCHGANGEGVAPAPPLIGRTPDAGYAFANDGKAARTIGNYWPYATTVFDYVRRAMPLNLPGTLTADQTYSLVAFLLSANGVIADSLVMDAKSLPAVQMPARKFFVKDNRAGGAGFR